MKKVPEFSSEWQSLAFPHKFPIRHSARRSHALQFPPGSTNDQLIDQLTGFIVLPDGSRNGMHWRMHSVLMNASHESLLISVMQKSLECIDEFFSAKHDCATCSQPA